MLMMANQRKYVIQSCLDEMPSSVKAKEVLLHAWLTSARVVETNPMMTSSARPVADWSPVIVGVAAASIILVMTIPFANSATCRQLLASGVDSNRILQTYPGGYENEVIAMETLAAVFVVQSRR